VKAIYARCSTKKQDLDSQLGILRPLYPGALEFVDDAISGMKRERDGVDGLLKAVDEGVVDEELGITEISRLGRSIKQIYDIVEKLTKKNVPIKLVKTGTFINYNTLEGRALLGGLALAAEIEWFLSQERWKRGRETIKRKGIRVGPKPKEISLKAIRALQERTITCQRKSGGTYERLMSIREIAKELGVCPATIYRRMLQEITLTNRPQSDVSQLPGDSKQSEAGSQQIGNAVQGEAKTEGL
jgi:DNA invertase Pin-like site-specific DNA recombinase